MSQKHTPEWIVEPSNDQPATYQIINFIDYFEDGYNSDDPQTQEALHEEDRKIAALIAAAPEQNQQLKQTVLALNNWVHVCTNAINSNRGLTFDGTKELQNTLLHIIDDHKAAIAKAEIGTKQPEQKVGKSEQVPTKQPELKKVKQPTAPLKEKAESFSKQPPSLNPRSPRGRGSDEGL